MWFFHTVPKDPDGMARVATQFLELQWYTKLSSICSGFQFYITYIECTVLLAGIHQYHNIISKNTNYVSLDTIFNRFPNMV